jgi:hypothetical protein
MLKKFKLTPSRKKDLESIEFYIPKNYEGNPHGKKIITAEEAFFNKSDFGITPDFSQVDSPARLLKLLEGKRWRGIWIHEIYEPSILEGSMCYWTLLGGEDYKEILPKAVVDFIKKELFKGIDKDIIEKTYAEVVSYWTWWRIIAYKFKNIIQKIKLYILTNKK